MVPPREDPTAAAAAAAAPTRRANPPPLLLVPAGAPRRSTPSRASCSRPRTRIRRVRDAALTDERYRRHAASAAAAAAASGSPTATAGGRREGRLTSLRSAVSVTAAAALGLSDAGSGASSFSSFSSFLTSIRGGLPNGPSLPSASGRGGSSGVGGGGSPALSPQGSLTTAGQRPLSRDAQAKTPTPPPLRSASDLLAVSPWAEKGAGKNGNDDGDSDGAGEADVVGGGCPPALRAKATDRDGTEGWLAEEEGQRDPGAAPAAAKAPPARSRPRLPAFAARRADALGRWWRLLPKF